jgi:hypothetical protein
VSGDDLALFVMDALESGPRLRLERHVRSCARCAQALAREAAAEVALQAVWPAVERPLAPVLPLHPPVAPARAQAVAPMATGATPALPERSGTPVVATSLRIAEVAAPRPLPTRARRQVRASAPGSSLSALAAAAMTVLFLGYFTDGGRSIGGGIGGRLGSGAGSRAHGFAALDAAMASAMGSTLGGAQAFCGADDGEAWCGQSSAAAAEAAPAGSKLLASAAPALNAASGSAGELTSRWDCATAGPDARACPAAVTAAEASATAAMPPEASLATSVATMPTRGEGGADLCQAPAAGICAPAGR